MPAVAAAATPEQVLDVLKTIYWEAGPPSTAATDPSRAWEMRAIAEVIRNRARLGGKTHHEIIGQPKQFSIWNPSEVWARRLAATTGQSPGMGLARRAWEETGAPEYQALVPGATHYYNPELVTPSWAPKLTAVEPQGLEEGLGLSHRYMQEAGWGGGPASQQPLEIQNGSTASQPTDYEVQSGDTLWGIAKRVYGDPLQWRAIARANSLANPNMIRPGQRLQLPAATTATATMQKEQSRTLEDLVTDAVQDMLNTRRRIEPRMKLEDLGVQMGELEEACFDLGGHEAVQSLRMNKPHTVGELINLLDSQQGQGQKRQKRGSDQDRPFDPGFPRTARLASLLGWMRKEGADYAPGLPAKEEYGDIGRLAELLGQMTPMTIQKHRARKLHFDLRLAGPEGLYSFALPKAELPAPGEKRLALQQSLHRPEYAEFEGTIPEGYGAGEVKKVGEGQAMVTRVQCDDIGKVVELDFAYDTGGQVFERFKLKRMRDRKWLLLNTTSTEIIAHEKAHYKLVDDPEELEMMLSKVSPDQPASVKIDGALALVKFLKDKAEIVSYRVSKRTGGPIYHSERVQPELLAGREIPPELVGQTLLGELYAVDPEGKTLPAQEIAGLLNASLGTSREKQRARGATFQLALLGAADPSMPHARRKQLLDLAVSTFPEFMTTPPQATTPGEARALLKKVISGKHPLSQEGFVFDLPGRPSKYKHLEVPETEVVIRGFTPGLGKYKDRGIGAIEWSWTPESPVAGRIGTGLSDEEREEFYRDPDEYIGRVIKVRAQKLLPANTLFAPRYAGLTDYPTLRPDGGVDWGAEISGRENQMS